MSFLSVAVEAAKIAGKIQLKHLNKDLHIRTKSSAFDRVTVADVESEKAIVAHLRKYFPTHDFFGEEAKYARTGPPYVWAIDPVDGTNNYSKGFPFFCVSIGLTYKKKPIAAVIYDAFHDELFTAEKGKGARLNGKRMHVSAGKHVVESLLITGFYYDRGKIMEGTMEQMKVLLKKGVLGIRCTGSAALDLANIAAGRADGFWELSLNTWDYTAGWLLVEEAGGKVTDRSGKALVFEKSSIVATNGKIHKELLSVIH
ncbi:MAG: inositol monophosphatase family protein [Nanoarchaeota archaeon]|nr:inositol monophosphatase family protein [Nanoarchaeota archaeon]